MIECKSKLLFGEPTRSPQASEVYSVASGDTVLAGGEQIQVTRGDASDCQPSDLFSHPLCISQSY